MRTPYAAALSRLCLSQAQAASLHRVRPDTVKSWSAGRNPVPDGAWDDLRAIEAERADFVDDALAAWRSNGAPVTVAINAAEGADMSRLAMLALALPAGTRVAFGESAATRAARRARTN